jgi:hypothetical protein
LGDLLQQPYAGGKNYKFYRDVVADYGADNTGASDTTEAINAAIEDGNRCGEKCGNTFTMGAIIYFPVSLLLSHDRERESWIKFMRANIATARHLQDLHPHHPALLHPIHR